MINVVFSFQADWLKKWREFSRPIIERRIAETWQSRITFDTRLTPLTPWNDYHLISPYNITLESHIKVTRIKKKDHWLRKLLIVWQILLVSTLTNILRTVWRICTLTLGCKGLKLLYPTKNEYLNKDFQLNHDEKPTYQMGKSRSFYFTAVRPASAVRNKINTKLSLQTTRKEAPLLLTIHLVINTRGQSLSQTSLLGNEEKGKTLRNALSK